MMLGLTVTLLVEVVFCPPCACRIDEFYLSSIANNFYLVFRVPSDAHCHVF